QSEAISTEKQLLDNKKLIKFLFIGNLTPGKNPLLSVKIIHKLLLNNYKVKLDIYGDGLERQSIEAYILNNQLQNNVILHGNVSKENIKLAYQNAHFLLFISKSEGWPKVVAEAMFWGCLPIASSVSCIPEMLGNGARGKVVSFNESKILNDVAELINHSEEYNKKVQSAMKWSRQFTLEKFESELKKLI
ncbi:MAG: glycosyltransferase, partial [Lutibacter sp.]